MNKTHSFCCPAEPSFATPDYAAGRSRNSVTSANIFSSFSGWRRLGGFFAAIGVASLVQTAPAADQKPTIPMIVKDTTTFYWQIVLAGGRKAGKDLNVSVPQFGAQSEAIVIAPTQFKALGKPIDDAAKKVKIIGIDSAAD